MYSYYKMLTFVVNVNGGESETITKMTKEVDGKVVPMTREESILKMLSEVSRIGGNPATRSINAKLFDLNGDNFKTEEVIKPTAE